MSARTITEARAQARDCRQALRDAFQAFERGERGHAIDFANEAAGRAGEVAAIFAELSGADAAAPGIGIEREGRR